MNIMRILNLYNIIEVKFTYVCDSNCFNTHSMYLLNIIMAYSNNRFLWTLYYFLITKLYSIEEKVAFYEIAQTAGQIHISSKANS